MKYSNKLIYSGLSLAGVLFSVLLFQNATVSDDPCAGSEYCKDIFAAMRKAQSKDEKLTNPVLFDIAVNRFGFGANTVVNGLNPEDAKALDLKLLSRALAESAVKARSAFTPQLRIMAKGYDSKTEQKNIPYNGVTDSLSELEKTMADLRKGVPPAKEDEFRVARTRFTRNIRDSSARFRLLMNTFGSQNREKGVWLDEQVNLDDVLSEFWFNHFNVDYGKSGMWSGMGPGGYEHTIRHNMHGTFAQLLESVETHPAMIYYLDNQANKFDTKTMAASNQNLGREMVELHTFGRGPGTLYKQDDVEASAQILAGLNALSPIETDGKLRSGTRFVAANHTPDYAGKKSTAPVFKGIRFCLSGEVGAKAKCDKKKIPLAQLDKKMEARFKKFVGYLASHPRTRVNICHKLTVQFVSGAWVENGKKDDPDTLRNESMTEVQRTAVRDRCIAAWGTHGNLKAMYRAILTSPETWDRSNYLRRYKNPLELVISGLRHIGLDARSFTAANEQDRPVRLARMAQLSLDSIGLPYRQWPTPTGYDIIGNRWVNQGYLVRWTSESFRLANVFEDYSSKDQLPLMGEVNSKWPRGRNEEALAKRPSGGERAEFLADRLKLQRVRVENKNIRRGIASVLDPKNEKNQTQQVIDGHKVTVPLKTGIVLKMTNSTFIRK